ncbi:condensation domain-containing protein, partial [Micromonospora sp. NPDC051196]|uniref:condensation domain-containing protein n=1 Tax=Micromonospora sp. NPDC051196 TaxID=3155281 RepID=UPI00343CAF3E
VARDGVLPLSFGQQRLWFLEQLDLARREYVEACVVRLRGDLDVVALRTAITGLVTRHEVLRTRLVTGPDGTPEQVIDQAAPSVTEVDLASTGLPLDAAVHAAATPVFDLADGGLLRATVIHHAHREHVLVIAFHHIVSDGWSIGIMTRELSELYTAALQHRPPNLPPLPVQYADFAAWQRQHLTDESLDRQLRYWRERLADLPVLDLLGDRPRPPRRSGRGATTHFDIPTDTVNPLRTVANDAQASLFMVLLAAYQVLLTRYTRQTDIAVGTPIAGRNHPDLEHLIGFFVNTLVLRADTSGNPTFSNLLTQVRETALQAYEHQDLPFERLVEELAPERDLSRTPLIQAMLVM